MATPILTITLNNTNNNNRLNVDVQASETKFEIPDLQSANGGDYLNLIKNILQTLYQVGFRLIKLYGTLNLGIGPTFFSLSGISLFKWFSGILIRFFFKLFIMGLRFLIEKLLQHFGLPIPPILIAINDEKVVNTDPNLVPTPSNESSPNLLTEEIPSTATPISQNIYVKSARSGEMSSSDSPFSNDQESQEAKAVDQVSDSNEAKEIAELRTENPTTDVQPAFKKTESVISGLNHLSPHDQEFDLIVNSTGNDLDDSLVLPDHRDSSSMSEELVPIWSMSNIHQHLEDYLSLDQSPEVGHSTPEEPIILLIHQDFYDLAQYDPNGDHPDGMKLLKEHSLLQALDHFEPGHTIQSSSSKRSPGVGHPMPQGFKLEWIDSSSLIQKHDHPHAWISEQKLKPFKIASLK